MKRTFSNERRSNGRMPNRIPLAKECTIYKGHKCRSATMVELYLLTTMPTYDYTYLQLYLLTTIPTYDYTYVWLYLCTTIPMYDYNYRWLCLPMTLPTYDYTYLWLYLPIVVDINRKPGTLIYNYVHHVIITRA